MAINTEKNSYTVVFAIIMVLVVGSLLAGLANGFKPLIKANERYEKQQNILYAMAFALFKVGDYDKAESYLSRITDTQLFQKAVEVRKIMADCADETWRCQ